MRLANLQLLILLLATGCSGTRTIELPASGASVIDYPASRRGAYVLVNNNKLYLLSEPAPDVATEITASLGLSAGTIGQITDPNLKAEYASKVVDLANRSQTLQVLREALFRLAEMGQNTELSVPQRVQLFEKVLDTVILIAATEFAQTDLPDEAKGAFLRDVQKGTVDLDALIPPPESGAPSDETDN